MSHHEYIFVSGVREKLRFIFFLMYIYKYPVITLVVNKMFLIGALTKTQLNEMCEFISGFSLLFIFLFLNATFLPWTFNIIGILYICIYIVCTYVLYIWKKIKFFSLKTNFPLGDNNTPIENGKFILVLIPHCSCTVHLEMR